MCGRWRARHRVSGLPGRDPARPHRVFRDPSDTLILRKKVKRNSEKTASNFSDVRDRCDVRTRLASGLAKIDHLSPPVSWEPRSDSLQGITPESTFWAVCRHAGTLNDGERKKLG